MDDKQLIFNIVKKAFNEWDPIAVMSHAPDDEYEDEISAIINMLEEIDTEEEFVSAVTSYCAQLFGDNYYKQDSVSVIASKIFNSSFATFRLTDDRTMEFKKIVWHDAKILDGTFSYNNKSIKIPMIMHEPRIKPHRAKVIFQDVINFQLSILEPWGAGNYISEVSINHLDNSNFEFKILLNSGDEIIVIATDIIYKKCKV